MNNLVKYVLKLKELLGPEGDYSIHRFDGFPMEFCEGMMVRSVLKNISREIDKIKGGEMQSDMSLGNANDHDYVGHVGDDTYQSKVPHHHHYTAIFPSEKGDKKPKQRTTEKISVLDKQVGGDHYKDYAIQPYEFFLRNQIPHHKAAIIRRILRYDHSTGGGLEDLQKIQHEIELIIELQGWHNDRPKCSDS